MMPSGGHLDDPFWEDVSEMIIAGSILSWQEKGGPPVAKPGRSSFGAKVTTSMVEAGTGGEVSVAFPKVMEKQL